MVDKIKKNIPKEHFNQVKEIINQNIDYDPRYGMEFGVELKDFTEYIEVLEKICRNDGVVLEKEKNTHLEKKLLDDEELLVEVIDKNNQTIINAIQNSRTEINKLKHLIQYQKEKIKELEVAKNQETQKIREENINLMKEKEILESKIFKDLVSRLYANMTYFPTPPPNPNIIYTHKVPGNIEIKRIRKPPTAKDSPLRPKENAFRAVVVELKETLSKGNPLKPIDPMILKEIKDEREKRLKEIQNRK